jgi:hypothetical protein
MLSAPRFSGQSARRYMYPLSPHLVLNLRGVRWRANGMVGWGGVCGGARSRGAGRPACINAQGPARARAQSCTWAAPGLPRARSRVFHDEHLVLAAAGPVILAVAHDGDLRRRGRGKGGGPPEGVQRWGGPPPLWGAGRLSCLFGAKTRTVEAQPLALSFLPRGAYVHSFFLPLPEGGPRPPSPGGSCRRTGRCSSQGHRCGTSASRPAYGRQWTQLEWAVWGDQIG